MLMSNNEFDETDMSDSFPRENAADWRLSLRTIGNRVMYKIAPGSGSRILIRGKTYQRSLPKGFGIEDERLHMILIQRIPEPDNTSYNFLKITLKSCGRYTGHTG